MLNARRGPDSGGSSIEEVPELMVQNGGMNFILVGLTFVILAAVLISCAVLGADRLSGSEYVSRDGIDCPGPERGPLEHGRTTPDVDRPTGRHGTR